jgi:hypothetical protein
MTRREAEAWLATTLMDKVRQDRYPSATQLSMIEEVIPREMVEDYLEILLEKVSQDSVPSIPMLQRISRVAQSLPRTEASQ